MLNRGQILKGLKRLGQLLQKNGMTGELLLTGGAAMSLVHHADALYEPKMEINQLAQQVALELDLPKDWLNDAVKGHITESAPQQEFITFDGLTVLTVTPEYLLAMKLMSARHDSKDLDDIGFLLNKLNIKSAEDAMKILTEHFPQDKILPKSRYVLEEYFSKPDDFV